MSDVVIADAEVWNWIHKSLITFSFVLAVRHVRPPECCGVFLDTFSTESSGRGAR